MGYVLYRNIKCTGLLCWLLSSHWQLLQVNNISLIVDLLRPMNKACIFYRRILFFCFWLVVFYVPSTARSFRDGTTIYCPLRRTWSLVNTPYPSGIEPRAIAWQSITLPLPHARSTRILDSSWKCLLHYKWRTFIFYLCRLTHSV